MSNLTNNSGEFSIRFIAPTYIYSS